MSPLPGWKVIPPRWAEEHRPTAESTFTARMEFYHRSEGPAPWPVPAGHPLPTPFHTAACRIQQLNREATPETAAQTVNTHDYLVVVSIDAPTIIGGERGDYGIVTESSDPKLVGRRLDVRDVQHGSLMWERDLVCVDNLTQNRSSV